MDYKQPQQKSKGFQYHLKSDRTYHRQLSWILKLISNTGMFIFVNLLPFLALYAHHGQAFFGYHEASAKTRKVVFKRPPPAPNTPRGLGAGTANRNECGDVNAENPTSMELTALIPTEGWGWTNQESPTFWFRVQYKNLPISEPLIAYLSLENRETDTRLSPKQVLIQVPMSSGIFAVKVPHRLAFNHWYRWYFSLQCPSNNVEPSINQYVSFREIQGYIYRKEVKIDKINTKTNDNNQEIEIYASQGYWYDALSIAAHLYCQSDNQTNSQEANVLQSLFFDANIDFQSTNPQSLICVKNDSE